MKVKVGVLKKILKEVADGDFLKNYAKEAEKKTQEFRSRKLTPLKDAALSGDTEDIKAALLDLEGYSNTGFFGNDVSYAIDHLDSMFKDIKPDHVNLVLHVSSQLPRHGPKKQAELQSLLDTIRSGEESDIMRNLHNFKSGWQSQRDNVIDAIDELKKMGATKEEIGKASTIAYEKMGLRR